jgi:maleylpyruvate isomerase
VKLYSYYRSTSSYRVRIVLNVKGIVYDYRAVNLAPTAMEQGEPGFDLVSPMRQIPVLEWQESGRTHRLTQSVAIVELLEEIHPEPALLPVDPLGRARVRQIVEIVNSGTQPLQNVRTLTMVREARGPEAASAWARDAIERGLSAVEVLARAHGGDFLAGDRLSFAEAFAIPQLYNARRFGVDVTPFEKLLEVDARCSRMEAFVRAHPDHQPDATARGHGGPP